MRVKQRSPRQTVTAEAAITFPTVPVLRLAGATALWRAGDAAILAVKADFGSLRDAWGDLIYTPNLAGSVAAGRFDDWMTRMRNAGLTHVVISDYFEAGAYPGSPFINPAIYLDPVATRAFLERILDTPGADGVGFTPIVMFDSGDYADSTPRERVDRNWPLLLQAMTEGGEDLRPYVIPCPGWELITASEWTSADVSYALEWLQRNGFQHIAVHNSPGRTAISSNPLEDDDPWQGAEAESYMSHGGQFVDILLFQIDAMQPGDDLLCDVVNDDGCPFNRWNDAVLRVGGGYHGWRKMTLVFFESVVYYAFRDPNFPPAFARDVATQARTIADAPVAEDYTGGPVTVAYGNGLPWPRPGALGAVSLELAGLTRRVTRLEAVKRRRG